MIELQWVKNDIKGAEFAFGGGRYSPEFTYQGAPINDVLDKAAPLEGAGVTVALVEIKDGKVKVF